MTTGVQTLSPSAATMWRQCPKRWWFKYVDGLPEPPPGEAALVGTFVHRVLELLLADPPADRTLARARDLARSTWEEISQSEDWLALELDDAGARRFRWWAWSTVEAYFAVLRPAEVRPVARELEVTAELDGVPFRGFIDLVEEDSAVAGSGEGGIVITDYKTGKPPDPSKPWTAAADAEKMWQPRWYAAALAAEGEHEPVRARLLFLNAFQPRPGRRFVFRTGELATDVDEDCLADARVELRQRWDEIADARQAGGAEANPGPLCGWCPFVTVCDEGQAECERRWGERNSATGGRRLREDAPAVALLGLS